MPPSPAPRHPLTLQVKSQDSLSVLNTGQDLIIQLGLVGGLLCATRAVTNGDIEVGDFVAVQMLILQLFKPLVALGSSYSTLVGAMTDREAISELLEKLPEVSDAIDAVPLDQALREHGSEGKSDGGGLEIRFQHGVRLLGRVRAVTVCAGCAVVPQSASGHSVAGCALPVVLAVHGVHGSRLPLRPE